MISLALMLVSIYPQVVQRPTVIKQSTTRRSPSETGEKLAESLDSLGLPHTGNSLDSSASERERELLIEEMKAAHSDRGDPVRKRQSNSRPQNSLRAGEER
jgi:hypothetical protein